MDVFVLFHLQYNLSFETIFSVTITVLFIMIEIKTVFFVLTVNGGFTDFKVYMTFKVSKVTKVTFEHAYVNFCAIFGFLDPKNITIDICDVKLQFIRCI